MSGKLWDRARGRWPEILSALKVSDDVLSGKHMPCPKCKGTDRFRYVKDDEGSYFCGDLRGNGVDLVRHIFDKDFRGAAEMIERIVGKEPYDPTTKRDSYAQKLRADVIRSTRSAYLEARGLEVPPGIRFHRAVEYREDGELLGTFPAMLAPITLAGKFLTYHVTYLTNGAKAAVPTPRKILPGAALRGAACALYDPAEDMGIAEGIETGIAAKMLHGVPVHAALNTSLLKTWEPPSIAKRVRIFADHDDHAAGQAAAWHLCHRLRMRGIDATVQLPMVSCDFNDVLLMRARTDQSLRGKAA